MPVWGQRYRPWYFHIELVMDFSLYGWQPRYVFVANRGTLRYEFDQSTLGM